MSKKTQMDDEDRFENFWDKVKKGREKKKSLCDSCITKTICRDRPKVNSKLQPKVEYCPKYEPE